MKKIKNILKNNIKLFIGIIIGIIVAGTTVYGTILCQGTEVVYTNSNLSDVTTVQGALDAIYTNANTFVNLNDDMGTPQYYAFGIYKGLCPTYDSACSSFQTFPYTTTPPSGRNVYAVRYVDTGYGVCIKRSGTQYCFRFGNWIAEKAHLQQVFSDISCSVSSSLFVCAASDFYCYVRLNGHVCCIDDGGAGAYCNVMDNGSVICGTP